MFIWKKEYGVFNWIYWAIMAKLYNYKNYTIIIGNYAHEGTLTVIN